MTETPADLKAALVAAKNQMAFSAGGLMAEAHQIDKILNPPGQTETETAAEPAGTLHTATATRQGTRPLNADAVAIHRLPGTPMTAAALVDGIGNTDAVVEFSHVAAQVAARVGARRGALLGVLAAAEMAAAPPGLQVEEGVIVVAVTDEESGITGIAWAGDSRIYGWTGDRLVQRSTDQTMGTWLRRWGGTAVTLHTDDHDDETVTTEEGARVLDDYARAALSRCSIATVPLCQITDPLVILTSDGVHGQTSHAEMEALARRHATDPQALADALVAATVADESGYRDDATAVVLLRQTG